MEKISIVTEEVADFPQEIIDKYQIAVVPAKLDWPELENLPGENIFQKMREAEKRGIKSFGKTSQPSPKDYLDKFKAILERFDKVLCITLTSKLSGGYNSAIQARNFLNPEEQKEVFIIDSLSASGGQALFILKAIDLIKEGKSVEEIIKELEKFVLQVHTSVIFDDPKWIEASGRVSHLVAALLRRMIKAGIRPVLAFKKGILAPAGIRTHAKDIPTALLSQFKKETEKSRKEGKRIRVIVTHGDDLAGAQRLKEMIEKESKDIEAVFLNIINNVVGAPAGPNTLILAWCEI